MILLMTKSAFFQAMRRTLSFWRLCLIFENEIDVGPSDNVVQLIEAHSLHTLFAIFEKNRNFTIYTWFFWKFWSFSKTANKVCKLCASMSWTTLSLGPTLVSFSKIRQSLQKLSKSSALLEKMHFFVTNKIISLHCWKNSIFSCKMWWRLRKILVSLYFHNINTIVCRI